jgi:HlyD family secretion protein
MSRNSPVASSRDFQTLFDAGTTIGLSDRQLLDRFTSYRDASADLAFEVLILRHGPMVQRVCRNLLSNPDDAQDAFQATFLVLVKRRGSIRRIESLGGWLYGVACRVAARARVEAARRRKLEERAVLRIVEAVDDAAGDELDRAELGPALQEEVRLLPERYRAVVVLCYFEGLTQEQAAAQLSCPLGTVRSRLARARSILQRRLTRRGLVPLATAVTAAIDRAAAPSSAGSIGVRLPPVAPELIRSTIQAASGVVAGNLTASGVTAFSAFLVQRVLRSMTMFKISSIVAALAILGVVGVGAGIAAQRTGRLTAGGQESGRQVSGRPQQDMLDQARAEAKPESSADGQRDRAKNPVKIYASVPGETTIVSVLPDGTKVKKDQVICELDSTALTNRLESGNLAAKVAESAYEQSRMDRELAEITVTEYSEGLYVQELQEREMQIKSAEADLVIAEDECDEIREAATTNEKLRKKVTVAESRLKKARLALELAQTRRKVLVNYTREKRIKELRSAVEKQRSDELVKKAKAEQEISRKRGLERQIAACTIKAPIDGTLAYAKPESTGAQMSGAGMMSMMGGMRMAGIAQNPIQQGSIVVDREFLFEIVPEADSKPATR